MHSAKLSNKGIVSSDQKLFFAYEDLERLENGWILSKEIVLKRT